MHMQMHMQIQMQIQMQIHMQMLMQIHMQMQMQSKTDAEPKEANRERQPAICDTFAACSSIYEKHKMGVAPHSI